MRDSQRSFAPFRMTEKGFRRDLKSQSKGRESSGRIRVCALIRADTWVRHKKIVVCLGLGIRKTECRRSNWRSKTNP